MQSWAPIRTKRLLSFDTARTPQKTTPKTILLCRRNVFTEPSASSDKGIQRQAHRLSLHVTRTPQKMTRQTILLCSGNVFTEPSASKIKRYIGRTADSLFMRHGPHRKRRVRQFFYFCVCIRCRGNVFFTQPLPSEDRGIHRHTDWREIFMK
jgi:hypothetical protein